jgi:hypothetical protein
MTDAVRATSIEGRLDETTNLLVSPARFGAPISGQHLPESADTAVATWLELIDRYFRVNRVPADERRHGPDAPVV